MSLCPANLLCAIISPSLAIYNCLFRLIAEAFDAGYLCFIPDQDGEHRLHLLDARLGALKLTDMKHYPWLKPMDEEEMTKEGKQQDLVKDATQ